jgi:membrane protein required for colicin V production
MNWVDAVVLVLLVVPMFIGFRRGLVRTVFPLLAIICGVVVAGIFYSSMADVLSTWIKSPTLVNIVAFLLVFALFMTAGLSLLSIVRKLLGKSMSMFRCGWGGFTNTLLPLGSILLGIALAGIFYGPVADLLSSWIDNRSLATIIAFIGIVILVMVGSIELFTILSSIAGKRPTIPFGGRVDTLGGVVVGFAIGAILAGAVLSFITKYPSAGVETTIGDSALAGFFLNQFPFVLHLLPDEFDTVRQFFG